MLNSDSHIRLLRLAGLFTWVMVGAPLFASALLVGEQVMQSQLPYMGLPGWCAYLLFGLLFFVLIGRLGRGAMRGIGGYLLLVMLLGCAAAVSHYSGSGLGGVLMVVAATTLPWVLPTGWGVLLLAASQILLAPLFVYGQGWDWPAAILQSMVYAGFCAFSFVAGLIAKQQAEAREAQRCLNAELRATRALLAESVRVNERTRISRELHDLLGHHLTALSLNLEVAGHLVEGKAATHVHQAHTLARLLLTDVREAVSQMREAGASLQIAAALAALAENVPGLAIRMNIPETLVLEDAERAHVLLRAVQEIITNTVRHAGASQLAIKLWQEEDALRLVARDDGRGTAQLVSGNGLRGLSERLAQYGGSAQVETAAGQGFAIHLHLPLHGDALRPLHLQQGLA
ncbi:two-component sensor histidine kinase [Lysobacteraceae bacterium NML95-0200]|nr:two-component sensor histidine kinase [Xanthomonadaceae bacterium NML95-0200]